MSTLEQLQRRYDRPCLPLNEVRAEYLPHITNLDNLLKKLNAGEIKLRYTRLGDSQKGSPVVYLRDLANWLDSLDPSNTQPAANQAA